MKVTITIEDEVDNPDACTTEFKFEPPLEKNKTIPNTPAMEITEAVAETIGKTTKRWQIQPQSINEEPV